MRQLEPERHDNCMLLGSIGGTLEKHRLKADEEHVDYFVDGQFIVTGLPDDIETVVGDVFKELEPANRVVMKKPERPSDKSQDSRSESPPPRPDMPTLFPPERFEDLGVNLYEIPDKDRPVREAIAQIYQAAMQMKADNRIDFGVYAEPNYLIGRPPPILLSGDPDCVEAGAVAGGPGTATTDFLDQWALGVDGINMFAGTGSRRKRRSKRTGQGIRVGIFDTSPFDAPGGWTIHWIEPPLELCVHHPGEVVPLESLSKAPDFSDHGLFVAGLVHVVAPESEIHLIRVLNDKAQGDLGTLVDALELFKERTLDDRGTLRGTVINLSLGIHPPPDLRENLTRLVSEMSVLNMGSYTPLTEDWVPIVSLETMLQAIYAHGAVIVAAAGNDSSKQRSAKPTQIPAAYPFVIGVAGSNYNRDRACFSNKGEVAAPSGDKGPERQSMIDQCEDRPEFCITSLAMRASPVSGYAHWVGTSFATPLVSGQAALLLEKGRAPHSIPNRIKTTAVKPVPLDEDLGSGVIHVPNSLH